MSVPAYPSYRDSGVPWIGRLPAGWNVLPFKRVAHLCTDRATARSFPVGLEHIESWSGRLIEGEAEFEGDGTAFRPGDILFGKLRPYLAKAWLADRPGEAVGDFHVIRAHAPHGPDFLQRVLLSREVISLIDGSTYGAKMPRASWEFIGAMPVPVPPPAEQRAIATFLDRETGKIDALVGEQERLIALLKEKRQAVISQAVTKGLDPNAPMKDSGVAWLGEVPAHWAVMPLGRRYEVQLGRMLNEDRSQGDNLRPYLRVFDVQWGHINVDDLPMMDFPADARQKYLLEAGDLLVNEGGSYVGRSAVWRGEIAECYYQKALHRVRPYNHESDTTAFLYYVMESATRLGVFVAGGNQTTIDHLTAEKLRAHRFAFPPAPEQDRIAAFVEQRVRAVDALVSKAEHAIALLKERRAALISAAVTGKIDVRGLVAPQEVQAA